MFEELTKRIEARARRRAKARSRELAERMRETAPAGVTVDAVDDAVRLSGRGLLRRYFIDPAVRWLALRSL